MLAADADHWSACAWGRRPAGVPGVTDIVEDLSGVQLPASDVAFCSLGTTHKQAGSDAAFRAIDFDLVMQFASAAHGAGARTFVLVSSAGVSARALGNYLRVKWEVESALRSKISTPAGYSSLIIVRPSLLLDDRPGRPAEQFAVHVSRLLAPALTWLPARGIEVRTLARAMKRLAEGAEPGVRVVENAELHLLGAG
jgi:uncharacterized protein YbjT (DUF2867 family)